VNTPPFGAKVGEAVKAAARISWEEPVSEAEGLYRKLAENV